MVPQVSLRALASSKVLSLYELKWGDNVRPFTIDSPIEYRREFDFAQLQQAQASRPIGSLPR